MLEDLSQSSRLCRKRNQLRSQVENPSAVSGGLPTGIPVLLPKAEKIRCQQPQQYYFVLCMSPAILQALIDHHVKANLGLDAKNARMEKARMF